MVNKTSTRSGEVRAVPAHDDIRASEVTAKHPLFFLRLLGKERAGLRTKTIRDVNDQNRRTRLRLLDADLVAK
jgi:hypothetical protein